MRHYVPDPDHPGQHIDIIELVRRYPDKPPPVNAEGLLKRDLWTRQEALLILVGLDPCNVVHGGYPIGTIGAGIRYLDGTASAQLDAQGLQHPRAQDWLPEFDALKGYAAGQDMGESKAPAVWLAWAKSKGFAPYWLKRAGRISDAPPPVTPITGAARAENCIGNAPQANTAASIIDRMNQSLEQQSAEALAEGYRPPEGPYRRTLPNEKRFFTVAEAALETASAMYPREADDPSSARVKGFYLHEVARPSRPVYLTDEQEHEMREFWRAAGFPEPAFPMERYTFDAYALALSRSELGKTWALAPDMTSRETHAATLRAATRGAHVELLRQAIAAGTVTALHPATKTPIGAVAAGDAALIRLADLVKFAASLPEPIELVVPEDAPPPEPTPETAPAQRAGTVAGHAVVKHSTARPRRHPLQAPIEAARDTLSDPNDAAAIIAALEDKKPPPFLGKRGEGGGLLYSHPDARTPREFTTKNCRDYLRTRKR